MDGRLIPRVLLFGEAPDEGPLRGILDGIRARAELVHAATVQSLAGALEKTPVDLILALATPEGGNPSEALRAARTVAPQTPFLVVVRPGEEEIAAACAREGAIVIPRDLLPGLTPLILGVEESRAATDAANRPGRRGAGPVSIDAFASHIAHEIKNPLTMILMGIEYLGRLLRGADPEVHGVLGEMRGAVDQANEVVHGMVEVATAGSFELRREMIPPVIEEALASIDLPLRAKGIRVVGDLDPVLPPVRLDRVRMIGALSGILRDAVARAPGGGRLRVGASLLRSASGEIVDDRVVVIEIEDDGLALSDEDLERSLDSVGPSESNDPEAGPRPFSIREIIRRHGGAVVARRRDAGTGTQVSVSLRAEGAG